MLLQKEQEQVEYERFEKQYGQSGAEQHGRLQNTAAFVPLESAYPLSAREVATATDAETSMGRQVAAPAFGEKTWERVQAQCNAVHEKLGAAEAALMMVLDFGGSYFVKYDDGHRDKRMRWNLEPGEPETMNTALFSPKGWMIVGTEDDGMSDQYTLIRQRCLPVVIVWLHKVNKYLAHFQHPCVWCNNPTTSHATHRHDLLLVPSAYHSAPSIRPSPNAHQTASIQAPTQPNNHAPTHPRIHAPAHPRTHAPTHPPTHPPIHPPPTAHHPPPTTHHPPPPSGTA